MGKNYGKNVRFSELKLITKDKKIHSLNLANLYKEQKEKLLQKNPNILFGRSNNVINKAKELYNLNIKKLDLRIELRKGYLLFVSIILILKSLYHLGLLDL